MLASVAIALGAAASFGPAPAVAIVASPAADAHTRAADPDRNFGRSSELVIHDSPVGRGYLQFDVRRSHAPVRRATLKLFVRKGSSGDPLHLRGTGGDAWREGEVTHRTAPELTSSVDRETSYERGEWASFDATELVGRGGTVNMAITSNSDHTRRFSSRETGGRAPRLEIEREPVTVPATAPGDQLRGVQLHSLWSESSVADFDRELDLAKSAGADTVRVDVGWSSLEPSGKGRYSEGYVDKADTFFAHARARGLKVIATLWSTPCWASSAPSDAKQGCEGSWWDRGVQRYAPRDPEDYADAAAWVTRRWGSDLAALEVWNEPNLSAFLKSSDPARDYAAILKAAYPRVKAVNPDVPILGGSLADSDGDFLQDLYRAGIRGSYDAIAYHPYQSSYNGSLDPDDAKVTDGRAYVFQAGTEWMRDIMVENGDRDVDLWATELGSTTCEKGSSHRCVTESQQAEYTKDYFRIARDWPFVKAVIAYNLRDVGNDPSDPLANFGLVRRDFSPKPAYEALRQALGG